MPPRYAYWTIILDDAPTSFRTKEREEILPLFNQLRAKNPAAMLKWFSGGRLWDSPEQAKEVRDVEKVRRFREERAKRHEGAARARGARDGRVPRKARTPRRRQRPTRARDSSIVTAGLPSTLRQAQGRPEQRRGPTRGNLDLVRTGQPGAREGRPPSIRRGKAPPGR